jgi:hypothetical protein
LLRRNARRHSSQEREAQPNLGVGVGTREIICKSSVY